MADQPPALSLIIYHPREGCGSGALFSGNGKLDKLHALCGRAAQQSVCLEATLTYTVPLRLADRSKETNANSEP